MNTIASNASWVWAAGSAEYNPVTKLVAGPPWNPTYFLGEFINNTDKGFDGRILFQADDTAEVTFNGRTIGHSDNRMVPREIAVWVRPGVNQIFALVRVAELDWGYGGFCCALLRVSDGKALIVTDEQWRYRKFVEGP